MRRNFTLKAVLAMVSVILIVQGTAFSQPSRSQNQNEVVVQPANEDKFMLVSEKNRDLPFMEDFEGTSFPPDGWTVYSQLDDSENWALHFWQNVTPGGAQSAYHGGTPEEDSVDNWLVTPQITIGSGGFHYLSFWSYLGNSWAYKKISVLVSTGSANPADGDYVEKWTGSSSDGWMWRRFFINLEDYVDEDVYIAFRYEGDTWGHTWNVDDVALIDDSPIFVSSQDNVSQSVGINGTGSKTIEIGNGGIQELTYTIDIDYDQEGGWLTVTPQNGSIGSQMIVNLTFDFDADGLDAGTYEATLNIATNQTANPQATITVTLEVVDVNVYPFSENFDSETFPPIGWSIFDLDGDGQAWVQSWFNITPGGQFSAYHGYGWSPQDGWLVAPQITVPEEGYFYLSFWSLVGDASFYDKNSVLISTGSGNPANGDFTEVWTVSEVTEGWTQYFINVEAFAGQDIFIAFRYEGEFAHYWIIDDVELGFEVDDSPILSISSPVVNHVVGENGSGNKSFDVINDGILGLEFEIETEYLGTDGWLTVSPIEGTIGTLSSQTISLAFDASGLEVGVYQSSLNITSNDPVNPTATVMVILEVKEAINVMLTVIYPQYTVPSGITPDGMFVTGSQFGGREGYLWKMNEGTIDFSGEALGIADDGTVVGSYDTGFQSEGQDVNTAGFWNSTTQEWEFLGMNPEAPEFFGSFYNSAYGVTGDGSTVVGLQWFANWTVRAFKWTREGGYESIGPAVGYNTRANGISHNGSVIYGWAEPNWTRTATVWYNDEMILIGEGQYGEAWGASPSGNFVTGGTGTDGFIWSPTEGTTLFPNTLNSGAISPTTVLDDGTVFGYTSGQGWPPTPDARRAFVRHPNGTMETFNEYVASRGWFDASDWIFFSVNDVTPDGNKFVGAAELPTGEWISFLLDLNPISPAIVVNPEAINQTLNFGGASVNFIEIKNLGDASLTYNAMVQYTSAEPKVTQVPEGKPYKSGELSLGKKKTFGNDIDSNLKSEKSVTLNYDGNSVDAIGLVAGGTFFGAARFPSEATSLFENYLLKSVDVYINDLPTAIKLKIWDAGTSTSTGSLLYEQAFTPTPASWNTIVLNNPVAISGSDIWVGFEITHNEGSYILGLDGGPANPNGDWLSQDAIMWENLSNYGLSGNWNIRANLSYDGVEWLTISPTTGIVDEGHMQFMVATIKTTGLDAGTHKANIRISSNDINNPLVIIPVTIVVRPGNVSVDDVEAVAIQVFPNPARNFVQVVSDQKMNLVSVINGMGQMVLTVNVDGFKTELDVAGLAAGMYFVRVLTEKGLSTHRLQVVNR